jgi:hypothetical protein
MFVFVLAIQPLPKHLLLSLLIGGDPAIVSQADTSDSFHLVLIHLSLNQFQVLSG